MGIFEDAYDLGAGATLGNLVINTSANLGAQWADSAMNNGYNNYRSENFDPIVRQDLNDIIARGMLQEKAYPFPNGKTEKKEMFIMRHKIFSGLIAFTILFMVFGAKTMNYEMLSMSGGLGAMIIIVGIGLVIKKIGKGGKKIIKKTYKPQLDADGEQYWYVREYVRPALAKKQMTWNEAVLKLSNTRLVQQFPDTVEEIEANAYYYKERLSRTTN